LTIAPPYSCEYQQTGDFPIKTIPHNFGVEQALLGALIFDNKQVDQLSDKLSELSFYGEQHILIWRALVAIRRDGGIADGETLIDFFNREDKLKDIGGEEYLAKMVNRAALEAELDEYASILLDLQNRRGLIHMAQTVEASAIKPEIGQNASDIASSAQKTLSSIMLGTSVKPPTQVHDGIRAYAKKVKEGKEAGTQPFLKTGIAPLDRRLGGGLFSPDLIILAGRPSMGKSMSAIKIADGVARQPSLKKEGKGASVLIHSLEMSDEQINGRLMTSNEHEVYGIRRSSRNMRNFQIKDEHLDAMVEHSVHIGDIHIDDREAVTIRDIRIRALDHIRRIGYLDMILIDYIQIMGTSPEDAKKNRVEQISIMTQGLKNLAKELEIPVVALAQLSRQVEQRDDKRPQLSDLRDSGSIEQDADVVIFVYREHYYLKRSEPKHGSDKHEAWKANMAKTEHKITYIAGKQRFGPVGSEDAWCDLMTGYVGHMNPNDEFGSARANNPQWNTREGFVLEDKRAENRIPF